MPVKLPETEMNGKRKRYYRLLCLLITLFMLAMGMRAEEFHADSPFVCSSFFGTVCFRSVSGEQEAVAYRDNSVLNQLERLTAPRSQTNVRVVYCLALFSILEAFLLKSLLREWSVFLYDACENRYRRRTLEYIHHMDGKKA